MSTRKEAALFLVSSRPGARLGSRRPAGLFAAGLVAVLLAGLVAACGSGSGGSPTAAPLTPLRVGLGYIPSVQFAQFYLADQAGYYRDAGLQVTFENKIDPDLITLVGQGAVDIGIADGTSLIPAASQGIPVRYVASIYADFPSIVFAKASSGITGAADLKGRKLGIPGKYGSSWIMLQALLVSVGLTPADLDIKEFPDYGQGVAVRVGAVDAATGFVNNEPVQLELSGEKVVVLTVDAITPLPGPGLITSAETLNGPKKAALRAFVAATLRAMKEIAADPAKGLDAAVAVVPELGKDRATQLAVLTATIDAWQSPYTDANGWGAIDEGAWAESIAFMSGLPDSPVAKPVTVDQLVNRELLP
jgi:NitT/TauT family transport system substrate-binding protein